MKKLHPDNEIQKRLKAMRLYAEKVSRHFGEEDIHQLRVNYKKARAFIRLSNGKKVKKLLPPTIKDLYTAAGKIRDLQLHIKSVKRYFKDLDSTPTHYLDAVNAELKEAKDEYKQCYKNVSFQRIAKTASANIASDLRHREIKQWVQKQWKRIDKILQLPPDEEQLHEIRKHLKDLHYTQQLSKEKDQDKLIDDLGSFIDMKVLMTLSDQFINSASADEKKIFAAASFQWDSEKKALMEKIEKQLTTLKTKIQV
ncbi:MAG: hypothetical protein BGO70_18350 [Bacteroidetes bacterium 43-93]|nr:CHAD domain-containing protein [Bacteroidota bacterium]OJX01693.1 MAG: hypothetical protein BGO70_18350 [Bacteroidetes bacterium 43-93]